MLLCLVGFEKAENEHGNMLGCVSNFMAIRQVV